MLQSEEDRKLKEDLETAVNTVCDASEKDGVKLMALEVLRREIRTATSSMTSVPKPLKFLRPSYEPLKTAFEVRVAMGNAHKERLCFNAVPVDCRPCPRASSRPVWLISWPCWP